MREEIEGGKGIGDNILYEIDSLTGARLICLAC